MNLELALTTIQKLIDEKQIEKELGQSILEYIMTPKMAGTPEQIQAMIDNPEVAVIRSELSDKEQARIMQEAQARMLRGNSLQFSYDSLGTDQLFTSLIGVCLPFAQEIDFNNEEQTAVVDVNEPSYEVVSTVYGKVPEIRQTQKIRSIKVRYISKNNDGVIVVDIVE
jgi:hypothetical protein